MENVNVKIIIYQTADGVTNLEVKMDYDTVWLTQAQMVELFQTTKQNVSLHVNNVYKECELEEKSTVKEYLTVQNEGKRSVRHMVKYPSHRMFQLWFEVSDLQSDTFCYQDL